ncbi:MAG: hypothetical protein ACO3QC_08180, partial [Phycisphaerales bacterium]
MFLSWVFIFGWHPPVQSQAASYGPSLNLLFVSVGIGIAVGWPLLRLSARPIPKPAMQAALDGLAIFMLLQIVVWPLRLVTSWTLARVLALDGALAAAVAITGAMLALSTGDARPRTRSIAMATMLVVAMLAPLGAWLFGAERVPTFVEAVSPPALLARFSAPKPLDPDAADVRVLQGAATASTKVGTRSAPKSHAP